MSYNYTIKYRTFDQLLSDVQVDFQNLSLENMIEPQQLIKVAKRVTYDLGLRIMMTKQAVLEICKSNVRLPDDFYVLNYALVCDEAVYHEPVIQGTNIQEVNVSPTYKQTSAYISPCTDGSVNCSSCGTVCGTCTCMASPASCVNPPDVDYCVKPKIQLNCKGDTYELVQIVKSQEKVYKRLWPLRIVHDAQNVDFNCPNIHVRSHDHAWISNGFLFTNLETAKIFITYQGQLEDDEGNLLVVDHPEINEYYEYAIKQRILENLLMNDENVTAKLQLVEERLRRARIYAKNIVNTPNFAEMKQVWEGNRKAQYAKYYEPFTSFTWY